MPSTPSEVFTEINSRIAADPSKIAGMNAIYAFDLSGGAPGQYHITLKDGTADVGEGRPENPNITITMKSEDFVDLADRQARRDHGLHERQDQDQGRHGARDEAPVGAALTPNRGRTRGRSTCGRCASTTTKSGRSLLIEWSDGAVHHIPFRRCSGAHVPALRARASPAIEDASAPTRSAPRRGRARGHLARRARTG